MQINQKYGLDILKEKITNIITLFEAARKENAILISEKASIVAEKEELEKKIVNLNKQYENLKLAKTVSVSNEDTQETKNRINNIVREIDKCIALLNQ